MLKIVVWIGFGV